MQQMLLLSNHLVEMIKKKNMILSVVVPVYNVEKYLARCLESIVDQNLDSNLYEIIIVNDGSPDKSLEIANSFQEKYSNIKIISQENQGLSGARNAGIKHADGKYIYFIDSDDYIERNVFKQLLEIQELLDVDFLAFKASRTSLSDYKVDIDFNQQIDLKTLNNKVTNGIDFISKNNFLNGPWWYIFKSSLLKKSGLLFEKGRMVEDGIFTTELLLNCDRVLWLDIDIYRYFINENSIVKSKNEAHLIKLNNDFRFVIHKFQDLIKLAKEKKGDLDAINRLKSRQESYLFFLLVRLTKSSTSYKIIQEIIQEMKFLNVYPMKKFIGKDYNSKREKILTFIGPKNS